MFQRVDDSRFVEGEHDMLRLWQQRTVFQRLILQNTGGPKWSFLDGPITANNPMGVHHAWGRTYKDVYQRYWAMNGHELRYQNGFDCQGLWVEVEVEKELKLGTKTAVAEHGIDKFVYECKKRVLKFAARQTEQSIRLGYWMEWDDPGELRKLSQHIGTSEPLTLQTPKGTVAAGTAEELTAQLGNPAWGGSYFTFSTENNETIWSFLKKCFERKKIYMGHDVMPWGGRSGSAYSQMEIADGRKLTTHKSCFVRFPIIVDKADGTTEPRRHGEEQLKEYLLVWTTTPWTLTSNVACMVNPDLEYIRVKAKLRGDEEPAYHYFAKDNLNFQRLEKEFKEGFGRPEWQWPEGVGKLKSISQIFKEQGGYEEAGVIKGEEMIGWRYQGPFDELPAQQRAGGYPSASETVLASAEREMRRRQLAIDNGTEYPDEHSNYLNQEFRSLENLRFDPQKGAECYRQIIGHLYALLTFGKSLKLFGGAMPSFSRSTGTVNDVCRALGLLNDCAEWAGLQALLESPDLGSTNSDFDSAVELGKSVFRQVRSELREFPARSGLECHRVIDGGRDFKGNPIVQSGEGTGLVHSAPGCGDIDHTIGKEVGLATIAPLKEDGTYGEGFGPFTGKDAIAPSTAEMVFESLKEKGMLVYVETYPHIYPHCWRTGDELVFRLVDEWFINMDWREEIKEVTKQITWLPDSIQGQEREVEWLTTMRDWMISKKRFWGLALPIWVNPDDPTDFDVMGSLAELKERAVEGWDEFEGHTPHRPWIDKVKIKSEKTGAILERIEDVGNPWLDAGIVPFSTLNYNERYDNALLNWQDWFPADLVTECFPGQFRNWFYSLLSLATMMRYDETEDPEEKKPFKNLLGHRLVMNEQGKPMHKSDGTAIWFEEAAEQLGVDTLRWLYLAQNPSSDLRFGTRHPDQPVTLPTVDGPISQTKEGLPTCKVTSTPADDVRRTVLIPLWNSYAFFVNYAVLDGFDPALAPVPMPERPEIDRWIISRVREVARIAHASFQSFDVARFMEAAKVFIDDLSNWYIRRNRRRFWSARESAESTTWDPNKLAAYQTLHEVLVTFTKLLAPCIPFMAERMYQNLVVNVDPTAPNSVHLCPFPRFEAAEIDVALNGRTALVQTLVRLSHRLRETAELRVRQPLAELRFSCRHAADAQALEQYADVIADELNVKQVVRAANLDDLVSYAYKPNLKTLGPKYGKILKVISAALPTVDGALLAPLRNGEAVTLTLDGNEVTFEPHDVMVSVQQASDWASADDAGIQVALSTKLTPELVREGMARDMVRHVQQLRKDANLEENDRITIQWYTDQPQEMVAVLTDWQTMILAETRGDGLEQLTGCAEGKAVSVGAIKIEVAIQRREG